MSVYLFIKLFYLLLLFLLMCCTLGVAGDGADGSEDETGKVSAELFNPGQIQNVKEPNGSAGASPKTISFCQIKLPFLLFAAKDDVMVAIAEAEYFEESGDCKSGGDKKVGVVAKFIETKDNTDWNIENIKASVGNRKTQLVTNNNKKDAFSTTRAFAVNAEGDKIYAFLLNITTTDQWDFKFLSGTISGDKKDKKMIGKREV